MTRPWLACPRPIRKTPSGAGEPLLPICETIGRGRTSKSGLKRFRNSASRPDTSACSWQRSASCPRGIPLTLSATGEARDYLVADYQNGLVYDLSTTFSRRVRLYLSFSVRLSADRALPRLDHLKYEGLKASASVGKIWKSGLQTTFGVNIGQRKFDGDYIFRDYPRSDDFWGVSFSVLSPKLTIRGLAPRLS